MLPAADDDRDLHAAGVDRLDRLGDGLDPLGVGAEVQLAHERLAAELQQDAREDGIGAGDGYSPTAKRGKRRTTTFSPVVVESSLADLLDRLGLVLVRVDVDLLGQHDLLEPLVELAGRDLLADVLRLALGLGLLDEDAQLGVLLVLGHVVLVDVLDARGGGDVHRDVPGERDEVVVAGDEVGVAVDLDQDADLAGRVDVGLHGALGGLAVGELAELLAHLDLQRLEGLLLVAVGLGQGVLAVHHPRAGLLAQRGDVLGGELSHRWASPERR